MPSTTVYDDTTAPDDQVQISDRALATGLVGFYLMRRWEDIDAPEPVKARAYVPDVVKTLAEEFLAEVEEPTEMEVVRFIDNHDDLLGSVEV